MDIKIINSYEASKNDVRPDKEQVNVKECMVTSSYAVVNPVAMVIESVHALVADEAVSGIFWSEDLAFWTNITWIEILV